MPRISREESDARREAVIDSCEALYRAGGYRDVTMTQIAEGVPFGRANVYNYFQSADEVLLALMQREHALWADDLEELVPDAGGLGDEGLADALAQTVARRVQMLRLLAMNLYDIEQNSRVENLVDFKRTYARTIAALKRLVRAAKPGWDEARADRFALAFMPFLHGAYPYAFHTEKQAEAMREAGMPDVDADLAWLVRSCALALLRAE